MDKKAIGGFVLWMQSFDVVRSFATFGGTRGGDFEENKTLQSMEESRRAWQQRIFQSDVRGSAAEMSTSLPQISPTLLYCLSLTCFPPDLNTCSPVLRLQPTMERPHFVTVCSSLGPRHTGRR
jgi:hypothetical protein